MSDQEVIDLQEMADVVESQIAQPGWADTLRERSKYIMGRLHESRAIILDILLYGGIGFLCGFLLRKYANYVAFLVLIVVGVIAMQQYNVINVVINWTYINDLFGFQHAPAMNSDSFVAFWAWCKANAVIVVSWIIGLLIGLKVG
jgi:uncharacterized membrane protein (Fun14 family)